MLFYINSAHITMQRLSFAIVLAFCIIAMVSIDSCAGLRLNRNLNGKTESRKEDSNNSKNDVLITKEDVKQMENLVELAIELKNGMLITSGVN